MHALLCRAVVVNLTNLGDGAKVVNMSQNGTASTVPLLRPMIRVWGDLIRDIYNKTVTPVSMRIGLCGHPAACIPGNRICPWTKVNLLQQLHCMLPTAD